MSWSDWSRHELAPELGLAPEGLAGDIALRREGVLAVRQSITVRQARMWLVGAVSAGTSPAVGALPEAAVALQLPRGPLLARPGNRTPASQFVYMTVRPVSGFLLAARSSAELRVPERWRVHGADVSLAVLLGIDVPTDRDFAGGKFAPAGVLLGRLSRRAWIVRVIYKREEELLHIWLRLETARADAYDLEIEVREYVDGDLADCRRLRIADLAPPSQVRGRLGLKLPTLGRGIERTVALYHRDGELLDERVRFNFLERIDSAFTINDLPGPRFTVGEKRPPPTVVERLADLERVEESYRSWLGRAAGRRVIVGRDASRLLRNRLARAKDELLVIDSYFGCDPADWDLLAKVDVPVRILTGWRAKRPPTPRPAVQARKWPQSSPPPYHDRFYLWQSGGLNVGTSPNGLAGARAFRIDEVSAAEAHTLRLCFEGWWSDSRVKSL